VETHSHGNRSAPGNVGCAGDAGYHGAMMRIADMNAPQLLELARGDGLDEGQVLEVLRNPFCTAEVAEVLVTRRELLGWHTVRERLAGFPGMSFARAMSLLPTLPWLSVLHIAQNPRTPPQVRRQAERKLLNTLPKLSLGETIALARLAHRPLLPALIATDLPKVQMAVLDNTRLVENDVLLLLHRESLPLEVLLGILRHGRWGRSYAVRKRAVRHARLPLPVAMGLLVELGPAALIEISGVPGLRDELRDAAISLARRKSERAVEQGDTIGG